MPLGYNSLSHGRIAFGFFHIETDMLLLGDLFFFADRFCALLRSLAAHPAASPYAGICPGLVIQRPPDLGDLHGAIAGVRLQGFLGALYARHPFPRDPAAFAQKPRGAFTQDEVLAQAGRFGAPAELEVAADPGTWEFSLGGVRFSRRGLLELVDYVWRGGMPGWQGGARPDYLLETARFIGQRASPWFHGLVLDPAMVGVG